ncbi:hypothetical protein [Sphingopyxis sp. H115]|uniref:hypothetical protein n=1 Tax=Sphingopyxis sp. H115 TaxID=1759073 RepID=UPI00073790BA|nr:hypothetical protein [Sphingopyxis sp. H115]KTE16583.1 hypothetical protein ATE71_05355 [Sphingopyxis sp. H115]
MDDELRILAGAATPAALAALDDRVLDALAARRREAALLNRMMALAAFVSLGGGVLAGSSFSTAAVAASPMTPLAPATPLDSHS